MPELVNEHEHTEHEDKCQNCDHAIPSDLQF